MTERPHEFALIAELFAPLAAGASGALGLRDDAALLAAPDGYEIVITTDTLVAGVHFLSDTPADRVARKALRVNLSDLAAKGAEARGYLLALSLPGDVSMDWLHGFADGLAADQRMFGVSLYGGDTTATPGPLTLTITAFGFVPKGAMVRRDGARAGDAVFVSGSVGDAALGLALLNGERQTQDEAARDFLTGRHQVPTPRLALGRALRGIAHAALDVSDGLLADAGHIAETSQLRLAIEAARLPLSDAFVRVRGGDDSARIAAATGGDDYEIVFTAPAEAAEVVQAAARAGGVTVTEIGHVLPGAGVALLDAAGRDIAPERKGFTHF